MNALTFSFKAHAFTCNSGNSENDIPLFQPHLAQSPESPLSNTRTHGGKTRREAPSDGGERSVDSLCVRRLLPGNVIECVHRSL